MTDENEFERIEAYVDGQMPTDERADFEALIRRDAALADGVATHRALVRAIEREGLRRLLDQVAQEPPALVKKTQMGRLWRPLLLVAAAVALLVVGRWLLTPDAPAALFATYYAPAPGLPTTLGATDQPRFAEGMVAYKLGEYDQARRWWLPLVVATPANDTLNYYVGVSYLATTAPDSALYYLERVADDPTAAFQRSARWYVALGHLQARRPDRAREVLESIGPDHPDQARIRTLLDELPRGR